MNNGNEIQRTKKKDVMENKFLELKNKKQEKNSNNELSDLRYKITGNHTVVAIDIEEDNVTLIIDPTNLGIGVYNDGEIIMFNEKDPEESIYKRCIVGEISYNGFKGLFDYPISYTKSFRKSKLSLEELEAKYGLEAQNKILKKIEQEENQKSIKDKYKIDKGVTYDFERNVVTIDKSTNLQEEKEEK